MSTISCHANLVFVIFELETPAGVEFRVLPNRENVGRITFNGNPSTPTVEPDTLGFLFVPRNNQRKEIHVGIEIISNHETPVFVDNFTNDSFKLTADASPIPWYDEFQLNENVGRNISVPGEPAILEVNFVPKVDDDDVDPGKIFPGGANIRV